MKTIPQQKYLEKNANAAAFKSVLAAVKECLAKPPYDHQRIIVCRSNNPALGPALAARFDSAVARSAPLAASARANDVLIVERADHLSENVLDSIVALVNQTRKVVVLLTSARGVAKWPLEFRDAEARIRRRTHITIDLDDDLLLQDAIKPGRASGRGAVGKRRSGRDGQVRRHADPSR